MTSDKVLVCGLILSVALLPLSSFPWCCIWGIKMYALSAWKAQPGLLADPQNSSIPSSKQTLSWVPPPCSLVEIWLLTGTVSVASIAVYSVLPTTLFPAELTSTNL